MSVAFISYSRRDKAFVQKLHEGFKGLNRDIWVDWEDIPLTSDWRAEIRDGIEKADNFIFVVSPDSAHSSECRYEVETAVETHKRIIPIVYRDVAGEDYGALHPAISSHNWIFCREDKEQFDDVFKVVIDAIDTDLNYIKEHTRLLVRAREWDANKRDASRLLTGSEISAAENWLANSHSKKPDATELHTEFIFASRQRASRVQQTLLSAALVALVVVAILGVVAVWQAILARRAADESRSLELAANAQVAIISNNYDLAIALGMESNRIDDPPTGSQQTLADAAFAAGTRSVFDHTVDIRSVAASADGTIVISGTADGGLYVWGLTSEEQQVALEGHTASVNDLDMHPDRAVPEVLSAGQDGQLIRWNLIDNSQAQVYTVEGDSGPLPVYSAAYHPDGTRAIAGYEGGLTVLWNLETGEELARFQDHINPVRGADFSADGTLFATGDAANTNAGEAGSIVVRTLEDALAGDADPIATYTEERLRVNGLVFNPLGGNLLVGTANGSVRLFTIETAVMGQPFAAPGSANSHSGPVWGVDFSDDGHLALSVAGGDSSMRLWFVDTGTLLRTFAGHTDTPRAVGFVPGQFRAVSAGNDATLRVWDLFNEAELQRYYGAGNSILSGVAFNVDETIAYVSDWSGLLRWYDVESGRLRGEFDTSVRTLAMAYNPINNTVFLGGREPNLLVYNPADDSTIPFPSDYTDAVEAVDVSPDGLRGVSGDVSGLVILWDLTTGEKLDEFLFEGEYIYSVDFHPDGQQVAVASRRSGNIYIIDLETREIRTFDGHAPDPALVVTFSSDGTQLASSGTDNLIILWNPADGTRIRAFAGHNADVYAVAFAADDTRLYSAAEDDTVRLWNVADGEELYRWNVSGASDPAVYRLAVSGDGQRVLVSTQDRIARLISTQPVALEDLVAWVRANRYVPAFSCIQQEQYNLSVEGSDC